MEKMVITKVKSESNLVQFKVMGLREEAGATLRVFRSLSDVGIVVDMILQAPGRDGKVDVMFTVDPKNADEAVRILEDAREQLHFDEVRTSNQTAKITLSGAGLMSHSDIVPRVLSCFYESHAPMDIISTSEIAIKVFTDISKSDRVIEKLREEFEDYGL